MTITSGQLSTTTSVIVSSVSKIPDSKQRGHFLCTHRYRQRMANLKRNSPLIGNGMGSIHIRYRKQHEEEPLPSGFHEHWRTFQAIITAVSFSDPAHHSYLVVVATLIPPEA